MSCSTDMGMNNDFYKHRATCDNINRSRKGAQTQFCFLSFQQIPSNEGTTPPQLLKIVQRGMKETKCLEK